MSSLDTATENSQPTRRDFLTLMGASLGLAGISGCTRWPEERLAPEAHRPDNRTPGESVYYTTAFELGGMGQGLLVKCVDGRPVKVEGNPLHPLNKGAADAIAQASVLELYDPDRSRGVIKRENGERVQSSWEEFARWARENIKGDGEGFCVLSEASCSPSLMDMRARLQKAMPKMQWFEYEPISDDNVREGLQIAFSASQGKRITPASDNDPTETNVPGRYVLELENADVIVSLGADLFGGGNPLAIKYARDFASRRRLDDQKSDNDDNSHSKMNRLYVIESLCTITGACADHRIAAHPNQVYNCTKHLLDSIFGITAVNASDEHGENQRYTSDKDFIDHIERIAADLKAHVGRSVVVAGAHMPDTVHAAVAAINQKLGNIEKTIRYYDVQTWRRQNTNWAGDLIQQVGKGQVKTLLILGGNPVYNGPEDFSFAKVLKSVPNSIHLALHEDETSQLCAWHLSRSHYLESWGDVRTYDGTISLAQPLVEPLFDGRSAIELLAMILDDKEATAGGGQYIVRRSIKSVLGDSFSEWTWKKTLADGLIEGTAWEAIKCQNLTPAKDAISQSLEYVIPRPGAINLDEYVFLQLFSDCKVYDGRFANNGWLQELPEPMSRLTWGNAALMSPQTAAKYGIQPDEIITLERPAVPSGTVVDAGSPVFENILVPAYLMPGMADNVVGLAWGYGRSCAGNIGNGVGANSYFPPARAKAGWFRGCHPAIKVFPTSQKAKLATVQDHHVLDAVGQRAIEQRIPEIVFEGTLAQYQKDNALGIKKTEEKSLFQEHKFDGRVDGRLEAREEKPWLPDHRFHKWGMVVDLSACTGCGACVVACQAENNIPIVGKEQVLLGREMHWIRIDRYFRGTDPIVAMHQPLLCMHCQNAPCESVCPVGATTHSQEGINMMTYNRCVGVRYCLNNCPYKVRRFNFFDYNRGNVGNLYEPNLLRVPILELLKMQKNPEATVRMRGVMEKCNYCIQRIEHARIAARREGDRPIRDGEIQTACQQTCPTGAIVFGDLNDPNSRVSKLAAQARAYGLLDDYLHTEPRTRYLAKVRNPAIELSRDVNDM
jgi:Fe-S-cluster-containing dehydrogenase component